MLKNRRHIGNGHIYAVGDSFESILRLLSPDYFENFFYQLQGTLSRFSIDTNKLSWGYMHPGYAQVYGSAQELCQPGYYFGLVTTASKHDPSRSKEVTNLLLAQSPAIVRASCSSRLFRFTKVSQSDFEAVNDVFCKYVVDDPTEWSFQSILPDKIEPVETWQRLVSAVASEDAHEEKRVWEQAMQEYSKSASLLLKAGIENTRRVCKA